MHLLQKKYGDQPQNEMPFRLITRYVLIRDLLYSLMIRVPGYRSRGPCFDNRRYQIFWEVVNLEWGPLSHVRITEKLLELKVPAPGLENRD
jgi:hypothetical protein